MPARYFTDSSATRWEVFEVHRHADRPDTVSPGLESGWLTFISGTTKRRLPAYPEGWWSLSDRELEGLLGEARAAASVMRPGAGPAPSASSTSRAAVPRVAPAIGPAPAAPATARSVRAASDPAVAEAGASLADDEVRALARQTRAAGLTAVQAMLRLKRVLDDNAIPRTAPGHKAARRLFVETFYFDAPAP